MSTASDAEETKSEAIADSAVRSKKVIMITDLPEGSQVRLRNGQIAEVTANPRDGGWLFVKILESDADPSRVGTDDMAFCVDVIDVIK